MSRLRVAARMELLLQRRYGIWHAAAFASLIWVAVLRALPAGVRTAAVPVVVFLDLAVIGLFFVGGLVLFEKNERTLPALLVTPLRFGEYLTAKLATLTVLALTISVVVVTAGHGTAFRPVALVAGVTLASVVGVLAGFVAVAPFTSFTDYLVAVPLPMAPLALPLLQYFGWIDHAAFALLPTQGSMLLIAGAFGPIDVVAATIAVAVQCAWIAALLWMAGRAYDRFLGRF